tara:strand:- start:8809 stop:9603 length:795 start_codon:yes stop_codon:yes gene_type:complete
MKTLYFLFFLIIFSSCSQYRTYQQILKSENIEFQIEKAYEYYNSSDYARAIELFEILLPLYKGSSQAEDIYYHYIYCNYYMNDYISTSYHAKNFISKFVLSTKKEELSFLSSYCYYLDSPRFTLDQDNTLQAISELEKFINNFPQSDSLNVVNNLIFELNEKLQKKNFKIVSSYYDRGEFKAAIFAIDNFLSEYPETNFIEESRYIQVKSYFELGKNSIPEKKEQRVKEAIFACNDYLISFPNSVFIEEVNSIYQKLKILENGL